MVGNYLAVIALSGMVAEMVAILLWELADVKLNERLVFGRTFERLGQERGIEILLAYKQINRDEISRTATTP